MTLEKLFSKLGCVVRMVVDSILPHAESGPNDHRKDALPFTFKHFRMTPAQFATPVIDVVLLIGPFTSFLRFLLSLKKESQANLPVISPFLLFSSVCCSERPLRSDDKTAEDFSIRNCLLFQFKIQKFKYLRILRSLGIWNLVAKSTVKFWLPLFYIVMKGKLSHGHYLNLVAHLILPRANFILDG